MFEEDATNAVGHNPSTMQLQKLTGNAFGAIGVVHTQLPVCAIPSHMPCNMQPSRGCLHCRC